MAKRKVTLSVLTSGTLRETDIEYEGETFAVRYNPKSITPALIEEIQGDGASATTLVHALTTLVQSWDIVDEQGREVPVTEEVCRSVPINLLAVILRKVQGEMTMGEGNGATSDAG